MICAPCTNGRIINRSIGRLFSVAWMMKVSQLFQSKCCEKARRHDFKLKAKS